MAILILTETPAGYAVFKSTDKKLLKRDDLVEDLSSAEGASKLFKLKTFQKFESAADALGEAASLQAHKVSGL